MERGGDLGGVPGALGERDVAGHAAAFEGSPRLVEWAQSTPRRRASIATPDVFT